MTHFLLDAQTQWMAPYAYTAVGIGFVLFFTHLILVKWQRSKDTLWYRQIISYRNLPLSRKRILETYPFYQDLSSKYQRQFEHRVASFINDKAFKHRFEPTVSDAQLVYISAVACQLTFGRRNYLMPMLDTVLLFDQAFESPTNHNLHKGEYNPAARVLALSWEDFLKGMAIDDDNYHLGLHEFAHVIHVESERSTNIDALRFNKYYRKIMQHLMQPEIRARVDQADYFRDYAFTNQYEFMAVLCEYFFESPADFKQQFPTFFEYLKKALLFNNSWLPTRA